jgi:hypothetical protein
VRGTINSAAGVCCGAPSCVHPTSTLVRRRCDIVYQPSNKIIFHSARYLSMQSRNIAPAAEAWSSPSRLPPLMDTAVQSST